MHGTAYNLPGAVKFFADQGAKIEVVDAFLKSRGFA
jgi:hypothetical protein